MTVMITCRQRGGNHTNFAYYALLKQASVRRTFSSVFACALCAILPLKYAPFYTKRRVKNR